MTRETKIGLLVGLAFIIVIGVLLSDHIQSATEPQRASLMGASDALHRAVSSPGAATPSSAVVIAPSEVEPSSPVETQDSLTNADRPIAQIQIGPGDAAPAGDRAVAILPPQPDASFAHGTTTLPLSASTDVPVIVTPTLSERNFAKAVTGRDLAGLAAGNVPTTPAGTKYVAVPGDTIYKMAVKFYGGYTKSRADMIVKANPQMAGRPDRISVGKTYVIPTLTGQTPVETPAVAINTAPTPTSPTPMPVKSAPPAAAKQPIVKVYTVKDGDSLWKIASAQGHSIAELKALNKDILKGSDIVQPGMKLKIPVSQVASAN